MAALVIGGQADGALLALAGGQPLGRGLQAVVGGVAHHVRQRILDQVEHLAVEFGVGAVHLEFDLLAEFAGEVADDARQLLPGIADRLHPRLHDAFLQLGGDVGEPLQRHLELGVLVAAGDLQQLVAGQHQLGDHGHQMFQRVHVDADRLVGDLVGFLDVAGVGDSSFLGRLCLGSFLAASLASGAPRLGGGAARLFGDGGRRGLGRGFGLGLAEGAFEVVERDFAGTQRAFQHLVDQCALGNFRRHRGLHRRCGHNGRGFGYSASAWLPPSAIVMQLLDQIFVGAFGLGLGGLEACQDFLDAIDRGQDQRHGFGLDRHAVAEFAHQRLAGMGQRFQPRQPQEAAGALDGVDQAEDVIQNLRVARVLLEPHQLIVDRIQALIGLRQELPQKIVHMSTPSKKNQILAFCRNNPSGFHVCVNFSVRANTDMVNNFVSPVRRGDPTKRSGCDRRY